MKRVIDDETLEQKKQRLEKKKAKYEALSAHVKGLIAEQQAQKRERYIRDACYHLTKHTEMTVDYVWLAGEREFSFRAPPFFIPVVFVDVKCGESVNFKGICEVRKSFHGGEKDVSIEIQFQRPIIGNPAELKKFCDTNALIYAIACNIFEKSEFLYNIVKKILTTDVSEQRYKVLLLIAKKHESPALRTLPKDMLFMICRSVLAT
jgi:hypothetical protein